MSESTKDKIYNLIRKKSALTISDIGDELELSRNTASKYLAIMETEGTVYHRTVGPGKIWFSSELRLKELANRAYDSLVSLELAAVDLLAKDEEFPISVDEIEKMKEKVKDYKMNLDS